MSKLTKQQIAALFARVRPILRFLPRCRSRLEERGFDSRSPFYRAVDAANRAVHGLPFELHYVSFQSGVGRRQSQEPDNRST
jgi:hypothetical protein